MPEWSVVWQSRLDRWDIALRTSVWLLLGLAVTFSFWGTVGKPDCQDLDFGAYYRAAAAVSEGRTPYTVDEHGPLGAYPYAPAYAYLLRPLARLEYLWACRIWMLANWLATAGCLYLSLSLLSVASRPRREVWMIGLAAAIATAAYMWANLRVGQAAAFMVLACLGWASCQRRGSPFCGGLLLAGACALKLAPLVLVPCLAVQRDRRGLAGVAAGGMSLFLLPALWTGWNGNVTLHREWIGFLQATQIPVQTYRPGNQSLLAQLARLPGISNGHECYSLDRLTELSRAYPAVLTVLAAGVYGWMVWSRRMSSAPPRYANPAHLACLLILMTLGHPRAWRCNLVAFILPCSLLAERIWHRRPGSRVSLVALSLFFLAGIWPTTGIGGQSWSLGVWLLQGKHFWGGIGLAVACVWSLVPFTASAAESTPGDSHHQEPGEGPVQAAPRAGRRPGDHTWDNCTGDRRDEKTLQAGCHSPSR